MEINDIDLKDFDIILQAGQSNAEGPGFGDVENPFEPDDRIIAMYPRANVSVVNSKVAVEYLGSFYYIRAKEREFENKLYADFSLTFCKSYIESGLLQPGRKLLVIRAAIGGTGFNSGHWGQGKLLHENMIEMLNIATNLKNSRLVAFLWHQGENDCGNIDTQTYYNHIASMVNQVRSYSPQTTIPFIAADFVNDWKREHLDICIPITNVYKKLCQDLPKASFIDTSDLMSNRQFTGIDDGDNNKIHFSKDAIYKLGVRYFNEFNKLI